MPRDIDCPLELVLGSIPKPWSKEIISMNTSTFGDDSDGVVTANFVPGSLQGLPLVLSLLSSHSSSWRWVFCIPPLYRKKLRPSVLLILLIEHFAFYLGTVLYVKGMHL